MYNALTDRALFYNWYIKADIDLDVPEKTSIVGGYVGDRGLTPCLLALRTIAGMLRQAWALACAKRPGGHMVDPLFDPLADSPVA